MGEGFSTSGAMEASREMEEQLGMRRKDEKEYKGKEKKEEVLDEIIKVYDGYNSLRKRLFRTITVSKSATKDELLHASMKAFVVTQVIMVLRQNIKILGLQYLVFLCRNLKTFTCLMSMLCVMVTGKRKSRLDEDDILYIKILILYF